MKETWKDIPGYEGLYKVSTQGMVKSYDRIVRAISPQGLNITSVKTGRTMKQSVVSGYLQIQLCDKMGNRRYFKMHRLVALTFIPNPDNKPCVNHKDGNKLNNNDWNLEWVSYAENIRHALDTGLIRIAYGSDHAAYGKVRGDARRIKRVIDTDNGLVFNCAKDAADYVGIKYKTLTSMLRGVNKNKTTLKYLEDE